MNPGLVVKLRPSGPWRIGPDNGARNRVDVIYHSDSLYSAVTSAMVRLGSLEQWLDATARQANPAVSFSSCFPYLDEIGFVVPPRTVWPPKSPALMAARVRWKSARFVPLGIVQAILAGKRLDDSQWAVDGPSECLVPAGRPGPFRTSLRWNAAVDRLSGAAERHSSACMEFRPGAGMWTIVSFADDAAAERWRDPVKAAFRLLADTGFGGKRSRGWGRADAPEFVDGVLPDLILGPKVEAKPELPVEPEPAPVADPGPVPEPVAEPVAESAPHDAAPIEETAPVAPAEPEAEPLAEAASEPAPPDPAPTTEIEPPAPAEPEPPVDIALAFEPEHQALPAPEPPVEELPAAEASVIEPPPIEPLVAPTTAPEHPTASSPVSAHWLLSLFTPSSEDTVDWGKGNYSVLARGGRVESPAGSGELKKQLQMVAEGSVLYAASAPRGSAPDVAPEGFAHPVFRAGFALSIPLPEGN